MKHAQLIATMRVDLNTIIAKLPAALRHLEDWTGEYPGSASGAPPSSGITPPPGMNEAPLTRSETFALVGDHAQRLRLGLLGHLRSTAVQARKTVATIDGIEPPVSPRDDASDLAVLLWALKRIEAEPANPKALDRLSRSLHHCCNLVIAYQPPTVQSPTGCRVHRSVGDLEPVYRGERCRQCWTFRRQHDADPSADILRCWSKNIKPTAAQIADAVKAGRKSRRRKLRKAS